MKLTNKKPNVQTTGFLVGFKQRIERVLGTGNIGQKVLLFPIEFWPSLSVLDKLLI